MAIKSTDLSGELYNIKYYIDDESGIKGYLVPLSEVGKARYVKDLEQEKCIYFLIGRNDETFNDGVYVGITQEQKAFDRLLQHYNSRDKESYGNHWNKALILLRPDVWDEGMVSYLEEVFWILADRQKCELWNNAEPSVSKGNQYKANPEHRAAELESIASLVRSVGCEAYTDFLTKRHTKAVDAVKKSALTATEKRKSLQQIDARYKWIPEIEVPEATANGMVDMIFRAIYADTAEMADKERAEYISKLTFLDLACKKHCELLTAIGDRLDSELKVIMPSKWARQRHIVGNQLFGLCLRYPTYLDAMQFMPGYSDEGADDDKSAYNKNIKYLPDYTSILRDKSGYLQADKTVSAHSKIYRSILGIENKDCANGIFADTFNTGEAMRFDIVIGNPPYNDDTDRGNGGGGNSLYLEFARLADELAERYSSLIMPSNWMVQNPMGTKVALVNSIRAATNKMIELHDFKDASKVFESVSIPGGVCYYIIGKKTVESSKYYIHADQDNYELLETPLYNKEFNLVFRDKHAIEIVSKVKAVDGTEYKKFNVYMGAKHHFDDGYKGCNMASNWEGYSILDTEKYCIRYYVNPKTHKDMFGDPLYYGFVSIDQITKNADDYKRHKLLIGQAYTAGSPQVTDIPFYAGNNSVCSMSYIPIFSPSDTEEECLIIRKYMMTQFFRYLVSILKTDQNLGNRAYALVPMQKFIGDTDIDWSQSISDIDEQLFKKYKLTEDEVAYIKRTIKPMA